MSVRVIIPFRCPLSKTTSLLMAFSLITMTASFRRASGSIVTKGQVINSFTVTDLGFLSCAVNFLKKSRSVIIPMGFFCSITSRLLTLLLHIMTAALRAVSWLSTVMMSVVMKSFTNDISLRKDV